MPYQSHLPRITDRQRESARRFNETVGAKPSGNPPVDLRKEGNKEGVLITDPLAIREAFKYDN